MLNAYNNSTLESF